MQVSKKKTFLLTFPSKSLVVFKKTFLLFSTHFSMRLSLIKEILKRKDVYTYSNVAEKH